MKKLLYTIAILTTSLFLYACSDSSPENTATPIAAALHGVDFSEATVLAYTSLELFFDPVI